MADEASEAKPAATRFPVPPQKIACGFYHCVAVVTGEHEGRTEAWSWGGNQHNVQGLLEADARRENRKQGKETDSAGLCTDRPVPVRVSALKNDIYEVACGTNHTLYLKKKADQPGGVLFASGLGSGGRLGARNPNASPGDAVDVEEAWHTDEGPLQTQFAWASGTRVLRVACGADHSLCYATDGRLYAWGSNAEGQCGVATGRNVYVPTELAFSKRKVIQHFGAGAQHSLAAAGERGELWTWGCGRNGRLGLGISRGTSTPTQVTAAGEAQVVYVAGGEAHSAAVDTEGRVMTWGAGSYGRLGHGEEMDMLVPKVVGAFCEASDGGPVVVRMVSLGGYHSLFLEDGKPPSGGRLYACGCGAALGLLAENDRSSVPVPQALSDKKLYNPGITQVAAGMLHSLALLQDGSLVSWGVGSNGRCGVWEVKDKAFSELSLLRIQERVFKGFDSSEHELRDPSERAALERRDSAVAHKGPKKSDWELADFSCGALHTLARTHGGQVYGWGCNANGQLGLGEATVYCWQPRQLSVGGRLVKEVAAGYEHCLAVTYMQELWAWGKGTDGQLGTGYARDELEPVRVAALSEVVTCAAGEVHSAAIVRQGPGRGQPQLRTWGSAESGMLGVSADFMSGIHSTPMAVEFPFSGPAVALAPRPKQASRALQASPAATPRAADVGPLLVRCGQSHTAVIVGKSDGGADFVNQVWTFGGGWYGRLGLEELDQRGQKIASVGTTSNVYSPRQVNLHGVSARDVSCGAYHTCVVSHADELFVWGRKREVCEPDDLRLPKKFGHIEGQPKIKLAVCGELHTLAVTHSGEVFVWGDNKMGQLGTVHGDHDEIRMPTLSKMAPGPVEILATGAGHTVAQFVNGEAHAWGNQSCGRLGLAEKTQAKIMRQPSKVLAVWCSIESMSGNAANAAKHARRPAHRRMSEVEAGGRGAAAAALPPPPEAPEEAHELTTGGDMSKLLSRQKVTELSTIQYLLKQEAPDNHDGALKAKQERLSKDLDALLKDIRQLPAKEEELGKLERDLEQSLRTNLRWFLKASSPETNSSKIDPAFVGRLPIYEQLLWVLQHQTSYLGRLSTCVQPDEEDLFYSVVEAIYEERSGVARSLFPSLLRLVVDMETENSGQSLDDVFSPGRSKAFQLISRYALSEVHYKDVIHTYLSDEDTLLKAIRGPSERFEVFALTLQDYKDSFPEEELKKKEEPDLKAGFAASLDKFREFLLDPFLKAIKEVDLPMDIRQLLCHALLAVNNRQFTTSPDASIPPELRKCEPLLRLFCYGILGPLLREPLKYASSECFLRRSGDLLRQDPYMVANLASVADFLEQMLEHQLDAKQKILKSAARVLQPELLKYIKRQAEVPDDFKEELMMDTYILHFSRSKHTVRMSTVDLMRLSNMLKKHMAKLRIRENDRMEALCKDIPEWSGDKILAADRFEGTNVLHNFSLDPRFLLTEPDVAICCVSKLLMPAWLCGALVSHQLVEPYHADNGPKLIEELFRMLGPVKATNFAELKSEFERLRAEQRLQTPPNFELMQSLTEGLQLVDEMLNVETSPDGLIQLLSEQLVARGRYFQYLSGIERGLHRVAALRASYAEKMKGWQQELESALDMSLNLKLGKRFEHQPGYQNLYFVGVARKKETRRNYGVADPSQMRQLGCTYSPIATFTVNKLKSDGVIVEIHPPWAAMQKKMKITLKALGAGGVELVVNVAQGKHSTTVKTLHISEDRLLEMKRAEKDEQAQVGNPGEDTFLTCISSAFVALVTKIKENVE